jgi:hypothetical protein
VKRIARLCLAASSAIGLTVGLAPAAPSAQAQAQPQPQPAVRVVGTTLTDATGAPMRLLGVDKAGSEYACVQGWGFFDGPTDDSAIAAIASWNVNAVRLPLNEDCWLGINGVSATFGGAPYRAAIEDFVQRLHAAGLSVVLDLHWNAPGAALATGQQVMADADHAPDFWASVATAFRSDPGVVFDLYNEPHDISWACWRDGCTTAAGWRTAGMQQLVDAVRGTGATQPIMLSGLNWAGDLSQWAAWMPTDPAGQLVAAAHIYSFSACNTPTCWDATLAPVAAQVPLVTGELGENDCAGQFVDTYLAWADAHDVSYLAWTWNTWDCSSGPALISAPDGTPTAYGAAYRTHLLALAAPAPTPTPTPTPTPPPTPTPMPTATSPIVMTLLAGFDRSADGWRARTRGTAVALVSRPRRQGSSSLRLAATARRARTERIAVAGRARAEQTCGTLVAWVRAGARRGSADRWHARLQAQDARGRWHSGRSVRIAVGRWTQLRLRPGATPWSRHGRVGVTFVAATARTGTVHAYVDAVGCRPA